MVDTRLAVRRRRTFVETELRPTFGLTQGLFEYLVVTPERQHFLFKRRPVVST